MINNGYKYWIFYINPEYIDDLTCMVGSSSIYAYTDTKSLADSFEKYHDMGKFIKKKVILSRLEVNMLAMDEQHKMLKTRTFTTHCANGKVKKVEFAVTIEEEKYIDLTVVSQLHNFVYKVCVDPFPVRILKDDIIKTLEKVRFFSLLNNTISCRDLLFRKDHCIEIEEGSERFRIFADEVSIYIHLFKDILKVGE